jgi:hypothetical protein
LAVVPTNPAAAVRGPKHAGKTPVLEDAQWRKLLASITGRDPEIELSP